MTLAVYGKHPAKGDFLEHGLPPALKPQLEAWLDGVLAETRQVLGPDWGGVWASVCATGPMVRFWLGEAIWGQPLAGVIAAAQDRVGRRFPLLLLALPDPGGAALACPMIDPDQSWYDAACTHLAGQLRRDDLPGPAALLDGAPPPRRQEEAAAPAAFWAARPGPAIADLLADITLTDHRRAAEGRSYWWVAGLPEPTEPPPEPVAAPEPAAVAQPDPAEPNAWDLPEPDGLESAEADGSPFGAAPVTSALFAPPEPGTAPALAEAAPPPPSPAAPRAQWSQVWAGPGLPSGEVLAWFFRGHAGNG